MDIHFINNISSQLLSIKDKTFNLLTPQQKKIGSVVLVILGGLALAYFIYRCCCIKATWMNQPSYEDVDDQSQKATTLINQQHQKVDDQPQEEKMPIDKLPVEIRTHILSFVNDPLLTRQVSKDWEGITQSHVLRPSVRNIENYLGGKKAQTIYQPILQKEAIEVELLSDIKKLRLLLQNQRQRLSYLLGEEHATAFLKSQPREISFAQFMLQEQWIKDYNLILMSNKMDVIQQASFAIAQVRLQQFDIASIADQLRDQINNGQWNQLQGLPLHFARLTELPPEIGQLTQLKMLNLNNNQLTKLPPEIGQLTGLQTLNLSYNQLTEIPEEIGQLTQLQTLYLNNNQFTKFPPEIDQLAGLQSLELSYSQLTEIPEEIGQLIQLRRLYLGSNQLTEIPPQIGQLTQLQSLSIFSNQLTEIPEGIGQLPQLQCLYLSNNRLTELPPQIGQLAQLQYLYLGNNQLTELPRRIGQLAQLQDLNLIRNPLAMPFNPEIQQFIQRGIARV